MFELTEMMRQIGNSIRIDLLNNVRVGLLSLEDEVTVKLSTQGYISSNSDEYHCGSLIDTLNFFQCFTSRQLFSVDPGQVQGPLA